jgi:multidrug efflux pump subunit AcrA (membrane-fusion protein)
MPTCTAIRRWTASAAAALLVCSIVSGCKKAASDEDEAAGASAVSVQAEHPTVGPLSEQIAADAILAPLAQAALAPKISAPVRAEYVQRGAHVRKGQLLLTLEDRDLQGNAVDSRGAVSSAQAAYTTATQATIPEDVQKAQLDVDQAKANLEVASRVADERKRLLSQGAIAGRDVDTAVAAAVQAQATYDTAVKHLQSVQNTTRHTDAQSAQGQLTSAQGRLINAEAQVGYASLRSPIDGVVTDRPLFPGETATAGTPAITVMDTGSLIAKLHLAQASAQKLRVGDKAELTIPGFDEPQSATVSLISPALDPGSTTVEVWLKLANPEGRYKVGTPVHATLHGTTIPNAVQVPANAIVPGEDGGTNVLVVGPDSTAKKRAVTLGIRTPDKVQILNGVTPADTVITEGGYGLDDGTKVKIGGKDEDSGGDKPDAGDKGEKQ